MEGRRGRLIGSVAGWTRTEWRTLLVALAISLAAHLALLATKRSEREGDGRVSALVVRLVSPPVIAARPSAPAPAPATTQPPSPPPRPIAIPSPKAPAAPAPRVAQAQPAAPAASSAASPPQAAPVAREEPAPQAAREPDEPASPVSTPDLGEVARRLSGRRLQASLWIAADGSVEKAFVKRNEIAEDVALALERALSGVRFTPARLQGQPVASELDTRLCFDPAGVLDTTSPECLRPGTDTPDAPANR